MPAAPAQPYPGPESEPARAATDEVEPERGDRNGRRLAVGVVNKVDRLEHRLTVDR